MSTTSRRSASAATVLVFTSPASPPTAASFPTPTPLHHSKKMYWAQLFEHNNQTYIIGTSDDMSGAGNLVLSMCLSSPCDGASWSPPTVLYDNATYHCAPTPVAQSGGYLYRAFEYEQETGGDLAVVVLRAEATGACGANLTSRACWVMSNGLSYPHALGPGRYWEEANAVAVDGGGIKVVVRLDKPDCSSLDTCNGAALAVLDTATMTLRYDKHVKMPTGCNKFAIRRSPRDGYYYALVNPVTGAVTTMVMGEGGELREESAYTCGQRNVVKLARSRDLEDWTGEGCGGGVGWRAVSEGTRAGGCRLSSVVCRLLSFFGRCPPRLADCSAMCTECGTILEDDTGLAFNFSMSVAYTGLQYIDFRFDGPDIIAMVRYARIWWRGYCLSCGRHMSHPSDFSLSLAAAALLLTAAAPVSFSEEWRARGVPWLLARVAQPLVLLLTLFCAALLPCRLPREHDVPRRQSRPHLCRAQLHAVRRRTKDVGRGRSTRGRLSLASLWEVHSVRSQYIFTVRLGRNVYGDERRESEIDCKKGCARTTRTKQDN